MGVTLVNLARTGFVNVAAADFLLKSAVNFLNT
jgi:hypothetical protein